MRRMRPALPSHDACKHTAPWSEPRHKLAHISVRSALVHGDWEPIFALKSMLFNCDKHARERNMRRCHHRATQSWCTAQPCKNHITGANKVATWSNAINSGSMWATDARTERNHGWCKPQKNGHVSLN